MKPSEVSGFNKNYVMKIGQIALGIFIVLTALQYYLFGQGDLPGSIAAGFLYTGGCLISFALIVKPLARLTRHNFLMYRRTLGVSGFAFMITHYLFTMYLSHNGLLLPSLVASGLSFLTFIGEL